MDLSLLQQFIPNIAAWLHLAPATLLFYIGLIATIANVTTRLIPDDSTGWKHTVRSIAAVIGIYVPNRVSAGITVSDVAKQVLGQQDDKQTSEAIQDLAGQDQALIPQTVENQPDKPVVAAFPGLSRGPDGKFLPNP